MTEYPQGLTVSLAKFPVLFFVTPKIFMVMEVPPGVFNAGESPQHLSATFSLEKWMIFCKRWIFFQYLVKSPPRFLNLWIIRIGDVNITISITTVTTIIETASWHVQDRINCLQQIPFRPDKLAGTDGAVYPVAVPFGFTTEEWF